MIFERMPDCDHKNLTRQKRLIKLYHHKFFRRLWYSVMPSFPIQSRLYGLKMLYDARDNSSHWYLTNSYIEEMENVPKVLLPFQGVLWDVGANIGLYSCVWRKYGGDRAVAFELSPKAASYIKRNAERNKLSAIEIVPKGLSVRSLKYKIPADASAGNRITAPDNDSDTETTMTYKEAVAQFGIPDVIKLDIEGHENEFLGDSDFISFVKNNNVRLIVEFHNEEYLSRFPSLKLIHLNDRTYQVKA